MRCSGNVEASATVSKATTLEDGGGYWRHNPSKLIL